jgi:hypothetical protein
MLTIVINEDEPELTASFTVPQCLIASKSEYFQAVCRGSWKEPTTRTVKLNEIDKEAFHSYMYWVYMGKLAIDYDVLKEPIPYAVSKFVSMWLIGDRLVDSKFRNTVMDTIIAVVRGFGDDQKMTTMFPPHMTVLIWSNLTKGRALRRLVLEEYIGPVTHQDMEPQWDGFHPDFIKTLAMRGLGNGPYEGEEGDYADETHYVCSKYHEHDGIFDEGCVIASTRTHLYG